MRATAAGGRLRLGVLRRGVDGVAVAAQYWVLGGGQAWLLKLAHAEESRAASPGPALTALMVRHLLERDGVRALDFGRGDDPYKRLWVGQRRQRMGLVLADPRTGEVYTAPVSLRVHPSAGIDEVLRRALTRPPARRFEPVLCTDPTGQVLGLIRLEDLATAAPERR